MAIQTINLGTYANDGTGDDLRVAFQKVNANILELASTVYGANVGSVPPISGVEQGELWWSSVEGRMYVYYNGAWIDASPVDGFVTYDITAENTTGGANLKLNGTDLSVDTIKFASGTNITVTRTDANTITLSSESFTGNVTGNLLGNVTGNLTGNTSGVHNGTVNGNVTGNLLGDTEGLHTGPVIGDVTGDVTGDTTGTHTGAVIGNVTGNLLGDVSGDLTGDVYGSLRSRYQSYFSPSGLQFIASDDELLNEPSPTSGTRIKAILGYVDENDEVGYIDGMELKSLGRIDITAGLVQIITDVGAQQGSVAIFSSDIYLASMSNNPIVLDGDVEVRNGNITGNISGNVTGDVNGDIYDGNVKIFDNQSRATKIDILTDAGNLVLSHNSVNLFNSSGIPLIYGDSSQFIGSLVGNADTVTNGVYTTSSVNALSDVDTATTTPTTGQALIWNGTNWVPQSITPGGVTKIIAGTNISISPTNGLGDVTITATAVSGPGGSLDFGSFTNPEGFTLDMGTF